LGLRRTGKKQKQDPDVVIDRHLQALGMASREHYLGWCRDAGFPVTTAKHRKQMAREVAFAQWHRPSVVRKPQSAGKDALRLVLDACSDWQSDQSRVPHIEHVVSKFRSPSPWMPQELLSSQVLTDLALHVAKQNVKFFFEPIAACPRFAASHDNTFLAGLALLTAYRNRWIRELDSWKPHSYNPRKQFSSLVHHLLDRHGEIPEFMMAAWFSGFTRDAAVHREWCVQMGAGAGLKRCCLPIPYSRKLTQSMTQVPGNLLPLEGLRWAQVVSLGGTRNLADAVAATCLGRAFIYEEFWQTVLVWLVECPMFDLVHVGSIIDYIQHQRFHVEDGLGGEPASGPAQPNFTMKGRSLDTMLQLVERWHRDLSKLAALRIRMWRPSNIRPFRFTEGKPGESGFRIWTIRELTTQEALVSEGKKLKHCVASYANSCAKGQSSIWTLELEQESTVEKRVTIEVHPPTRTIVQARGKLNRLPNDQESSIIRRWSTAASLVLRIA
jgi:hypothetical protein